MNPRRAPRDRFSSPRGCRSRSGRSRTPPVRTLGRRDTRRARARDTFARARRHPRRRATILNAQTPPLGTPTRARHRATKPRAHFRDPFSARLSRANARYRVSRTRRRARRRRARVPAPRRTPLRASPTPRRASLARLRSSSTIPSPRARARPPGTRSRRRSRCPTRVRARAGAREARTSPRLASLSGPPPR